MKNGVKQNIDTSSVNESARNLVSNMPVFVRRFISKFYDTSMPAGARLKGDVGTCEIIVVAGNFFAT